MQCSAGECGLLSFGDSIAAGYGLGNSEGSGNDNEYAYPAIMAGQLNSAYENLAVEGACASNEEPYCTKVNVSKQIANATSGNFYPSRITLTVGADDINFAGCLKAIVTTPDLNRTNATDPCSPANLKAALAAFSKALQTDLQTLANTYKNVGIQVMNYYNPFPPAPPATACSAIDIFTLQYDAASYMATFHVPQDVADATAFLKYRYNHAAFERDASEVETRLYIDAEDIILQLNNTIDATAVGVSGVTTVATDDLGFQNICSPAPQSVFAPYVNWSETETTFINDTTTLASGHLGADNGPVCVDAFADPNPTFVDLLFPNPFGPAVHFSLSGYLNCFPHPTAQGQAEIATRFLG